MFKKRHFALQKFFAKMLENMLHFLQFFLRLEGTLFLP